MSMPPPPKPSAAKKNKRKARAPVSRPTPPVTVEDGFYAAPIQEPGFDTTKIRDTQFRNTARQAKPAVPPTSLFMIHYGALHKSEHVDGSTLRSATPSERFNSERNDANAATYKAGGSVLRLYFPATETSPAHFEDCMVCDSSVCRDERCVAGMPEQARLNVLPVPSALPFVHYADCTEDGEVNLEFYPGIVSDNSSGFDVPFETEEMEVGFHDGFARMRVLSRVCMADCLVCEFWGRKAEEAKAKMDGKMEQ